MSKKNTIIYQDFDVILIMQFDFKVMHNNKVSQDLEIFKNAHQKRYTRYIVNEKLAEHLKQLMYESDLEAYQKSK